MFSYIHLLCFKLDCYDSLLTEFKTDIEPFTFKSNRSDIHDLVHLSGSPVLVQAQFKSSQARMEASFFDVIGCQATCVCMRGVLVYIVRRCGQVPSSNYHNTKLSLRRSYMYHYNVKYISFGIAWLTTLTDSWINSVSYWGNLSVPTLKLIIVITVCDNVVQISVDISNICH